MIKAIPQGMIILLSEGTDLGLWLQSSTRMLVFRGVIETALPMKISSLSHTKEKGQCPKVLGKNQQVNRQQWIHLSTCSCSMPFLHPEHPRLAHPSKDLTMLLEW